MDGEELLFTYGVLHFWCMDAILRLAQKSAPKNDSIDWPYTLRQLSLSIRRFDLDLLVRVAIKSQDLPSVLDLVRIWVCRQEYRREIFRRLDVYRLSRPLLKYLRKNSGIRELADLLSVTRSQIEAWIRTRKIKNIPLAKKKVSKSLELHFNSSHQNESSVKILSKLPEQLQDIRSESLLVIHELCQQCKDALADHEIDQIEIESGQSFDGPLWIRDGEILDVSSNPIMQRHPFENPMWDQKLHAYLLIDINIGLKRLLPLIDGSLEITPLKVYDRRRTEDRREMKEANYISYDELHDREYKVKGERSPFSKEPFPLSKEPFRPLKEFGPLSKGPFPLSEMELDSMKIGYLFDNWGYWEQIEPVDLIHARKEFRVRFESKLENVNPPRKRSQIRQAIRLILCQDKSIREAAIETGLSEKTVSKYTDELGLSTILHK